jgi:uncharacterized protein (TIGR00255 family)
MTGFGRAQFEVNGLAFDVEVRSVNHRYLDARVRLPRLLAGFEADLRARIQARISRGKLDASVVSPGGAAAGQRLAIDLEAAAAYLRAAAELRQRHGVGGELRAQELLALPGVARFVEPEVTPEALREALFGGVDRALDALDAMRVAEGRALERDLAARVARVEEIAGSLATRAEALQRAVRERLRRRAEQLRQETGLLDDARLHQEVVIFADRMDVAEEIVRLRSHVDQFRAITGEADAAHPVGRRLDFLLQEFSREANTIGSKAADAPLAHEIVELKTEIERLREQVQNVE